MKRRSRCLSALALAVVSCAPACRRSPPQPAAGGELLLLAVPTAAAVVVGRVEESGRVDVHGYAAWLRVERVLAGSATPGARLRIAWEELSANRPPRLTDGERILVALDPLPPGSLWTSRFPNALTGERVLAVGAKGDGFLREPDAASIVALSRYLSVPPAVRTAAAGVNVLAEFVAQAAPGLSAAAMMRLDSIDSLDQKLGAEAVGQLQQALFNPQRPLDLRRAIIALAVRHRLAPFHESLQVLARAGSPLEADAVAALGALDGRLSAEQVDALLTRPEPNLRAVGARFARDPASQRRLAALVRSDDSPAVRAAAARTLVEVGGTDALPQVAPALADADAAVRTEAARALGALGGVAVPPLLALARGGSVDQAKGAITALDLAGPAGARALGELAATHPDEQIRTLARLALGQAPTPH